jgi:hypothetical protein
MFLFEMLINIATYLLFFFINDKAQVQLYIYLLRYVNIYF